MILREQLDRYLHRFCRRAGLETALYRAEARLISRLSKSRWFRARYRRAQTELFERFLRETRILEQNPDLDPATEVQQALLADHMMKRWNRRWPLHACPRPQVVRLIDVENEGVLEEAHRAGRGVILAQFHAFAARLVFPWLEHRGIHPLYSIDRKGPPTPGVKAGSAHSTPAASLAWARDLLAARRCLGQGGVVRILPDGFHGKSGLSHVLHHRKREFRTAFAELAIDTGATVLPTSAVLKPDGRMRVRFHAALSSGDLTLPREVRMRMLMEQYVTFLSAEWCAAPANVSSIHMRSFLERSSAATPDH